MVRLVLILLAGAALVAPVRAQGPYSPGNTVELQAIGDRWQTCTVIDPGAEERVMRLKCEPYDDGVYSRGGGIYVETWKSTAVRRPGTGKPAATERAPAAPRAAAPAPRTATRPATAPARAPAPAAAGGTLPLGEYACYGSGMRILAGLGFKLRPGGRYTDLEGGNAGSYVVSGGSIRFAGGHLDGQVGRDVAGKGFRIGAQATCELWG